MGKRKNHHYVPRFYLKKFSNNNEGKFIGLYNHANNIFIQNAPIKHQASKDYLYGEDDEIENELSKLENSISKLFYYWTEEKILIPPPENTNGFIVLKRFILYQIFRTPKAGDVVNKSIDQTFKVIIRNFYPEMWDKVKDGTISHSDPVSLALLNSADKEHLLNFLTCRFLVNLSDLPFITSDSPVIMYNQLMENFGQYTGATGLASKGLQIFYPIHPRLMICLFDTEEYNYGNENCISTELITDIHQLNALQYINCNSQIFFNEYIEKEYIDIIIESFKKEKSYGKKTINKFMKTSDNRKFLYSSFEDVKIGLDLSFITFKKRNSKNTYFNFTIRHESLGR